MDSGDMDTRSGAERPTILPLYDCPRCGEPKPRAAFGTRGKYKASYCRPCYTDYQRDYRNTPEGKAKFNATQDAIRARLPNRKRARNRVWSAIQSGRLVLGACELTHGCDGPIEAHHDDYDKPLDVRWLCRTHHRQIDKGKFGRRASPESEPNG